jgi:hypothetical protein
MFHLDSPTNRVMNKNKEMRETVLGEERVVAIAF